MMNSLRYWKHVAIALAAVAVLLPFGLQYFESSEYTSVSRLISREQVPVDPFTLEDYVGIYHLRPGFEVEVSTLNGRLFAQATQQQRVEFHPASDSIFFNDITPLLLHFERDDEGEVVRFLALEPGRTRVATKMRVEAHDG